MVSETRFQSDQARVANIPRQAKEIDMKIMLPTSDAYVQRLQDLRTEFDQYSYFRSFGDACSDFISYARGDTDLTQYQERAKELSERRKRTNVNVQEPPSDNSKTYFSGRISAVIQTGRPSTDGISPVVDKKPKHVANGSVTSLSSIEDVEFSDVSEPKSAQP